MVGKNCLISFSFFYLPSIAMFTEGVIFAYFTQEIATAKRSLKIKRFFNVPIKRQITKDKVYVHTKEVE